MFNALISKGMGAKFKPVPTGNNILSNKDAIKAATATTGTIEYSPYSVFPPGTVVRIGPIGSKYFGYGEHFTFKVGTREYEDQRGVYIYRDSKQEPEVVHWMGCFRARPVVSTSGDADLLDQLISKKIHFHEDGWDSDRRKKYVRVTTPCSEFDDTTSINYLRLAREITDWQVMEALAGGVWKVEYHLVAETRKFRKGMPPELHYMNVPIFTRIGDWEDPEEK